MIENGIPASPIIYGSVLSLIMKELFGAQKGVGRSKLFTVKYLMTKMTQGLESGILRRGWVNDI